MANKASYDVAIIGAGIGGLVCGCYLAKAGLKVLIAEKHNKPGGYCTSFEREGYSFDVAVHYLGSCREGGELNRIIKDHSLQNELQLNRIDPCDKIIMPSHIVFVRKEWPETVESFKNAFPHESRNLDSFFKFVLQDDFRKIYIKTVKYTFLNLLDIYFQDYRLKATLSVLLGNIGLSASNASALVAVILFREYICDPGYYPYGGIQILPNLLAKRFLEYGGQLLLSTEVTRIIYKNRTVCGVVLNSGERVKSKFIVSNIDAHLTFKKLFNCVEKNINNKLKQLKTSVSAFVCYLGINEKTSSLNKAVCTTWYFKTYRVDDCYNNPVDPRMSRKLRYIVCTFPTHHSKKINAKKRSSMQILFGAKFLPEGVWLKYKYKLANEAIAMASDIVPNLANGIEVTTISTPQDFYRYTYNYKGAMYGWASLYSQIDRSIFPQRTPLKNLILAGHWSTNGFGQSGIPVVALSGKNAARLILAEVNQKNN